MVDATPVPDDKIKVISSIPDATVKEMNHAQWLGEFAYMLGIQRPGGPPMTVFRQGATERLRLAKRYIEILERELGEATGCIETLKKELEHERDGTTEGR